jgi:mannose-1-phosphate guanylyltransferase / phosphomannomutase
MKGVVLCAGLGTRLGVLTKERPKCMMMAGGYPLLQYIIGNIKKSGIIEIAINLHYYPEVICDYFGDGDRFGVDITYFYEEKLLGTAGALYSMKKWIGRDTSVMVHYGDVVTNFAIGSLVDRHVCRGGFATLLVHRRKISNSRIRVDNSDKVIEFEERPREGRREDEGKEFYVNSGVQVISRELLEIIEESQVMDLPKDIYSIHFREKPIYVVPMSGRRHAVDSQSRLEAVALAAQRGEYVPCSRDSGVGN